MVEHGADWVYGQVLYRDAWREALYGYAGSSRC